MAQNFLRAENRQITIQPTMLINELYIKMAQGENYNFNDRAHLLAVAALAMRNLLTDYGRARRAARRGGVAVKLPINEALDNVMDPNLSDLDGNIYRAELMEKLSTFNPLGATIIDLKAVGMTNEQIAEHLNISIDSVKRKFKNAFAKLSEMHNNKKADNE
jgi:RNA polymerase sigma factor (TIGR02999 family)